jgi:hypothetical protein
MNDYRDILNRLFLGRGLMMTPEQPQPLGLMSAPPQAGMFSGLMSPQAAMFQQPSDPHDFTNRYNTKLSPAEEKAFLLWAKDRVRDTYDYDLRGAYKANAQEAANGHLPDTYKKPNHPTFSDQSQYNNVDGYTGGQWLSNGEHGSRHRWTYAATPTNLQFHDAADLLRYFQQVESGNTVKLPGGHR